MLFEAKDKDNGKERFKLILTDEKTRIGVDLVKKK